VEEDFGVQEVLFSALRGSLWVFSRRTISGRRCRRILKQFASTCFHVEAYIAGNSHVRYLLLPACFNSIFSLSFFFFGFRLPLQ
jgi:hypothetical protein